jgi:hypothetical protein
VPRCPKRLCHACNLLGGRHELLSACRALTSNDASRRYINCKTQLIWCSTCNDSVNEQELDRKIGRNRRHGLATIIDVLLLGASCYNDVHKELWRVIRSTNGDGRTEAAAVLVSALVWAGVE